MNFDRRAQKPAFYGEPISAQYLPAAELIRLFDEAKAKIIDELIKDINLHIEK